jgi:hypothetical protein
MQLQQRVGVISHRTRLSIRAHGSAAAPSSRTQHQFTCKRCKTKFNAAENTRTSCRFHPALYSGGEMAKAIGFVRAGDAPSQQLRAVTGRQGLLRFWDCCGAEDETAAGCETSYHITWDDQLNQTHGWE